MSASQRWDVFQSLPLQCSARISCGYWIKMSRLLLSFYFWVGYSYTFYYWWHKASFKYFFIPRCILSVIPSTFWAFFGQAFSDEHGGSTVIPHTYDIMGKNTVIISQSCKKECWKNTLPIPLSCLSEALPSISSWLCAFLSRPLPCQSVDEFVLGCIGMAEKLDINCADKLVK